MSSLRHAYRARVVTVLALVLTVGAIGSIAEGQQVEEKKLSNAQLEQLVSQIALYPDTLLSQIMMASTYPLEVVRAARWQKANEKLKGDALAKAVEKQSWDASVKSLVNFPQVLTMMNERLSWTQKLGDAVLGQQKEVMAAIQRLRAKANDAGNLKSTEQQTVIVKEETIVIQPASTEVIYVPTYNPTVVYGAWPYPAYPAPAPYYPPGYVAGAAVLGFAAGVALSGCWGYAWGNCNWNGGDIDIDVDRNSNRNSNINRERSQTRQNMNDRRGGREGAGRGGGSRGGAGRGSAGRGSAGRGGGSGSWRHDPKHRKGVGYSDRKTSQRFDRGGNARRQQSRQQFRGRADTGFRSSGRSGRGSTARSGRSNTGRSGSSRSSAGRGRSSRSGGAFGGSRSGRSSRSNASRGRSSRSSSGARRSSGYSGRSRGGGGRSRGGGGRSRGGGGRRR